MSDAAANDPTDPIDPRTFLIVNPLRVLVDTSRADPGTGRGIGYARATAGARQIAPVFTERELAERDLPRAAGAALEVREVPTPHHWLELLEEWSAMGYTHVCFDPGPKRMRLLPLPRVLEEARSWFRPEKE